jgi:hypothetical protein
MFANNEQYHRAVQLHSAFTSMASMLSIDCSLLMLENVVPELKNNVYERVFNKTAMQSFEAKNSVNFINIIQLESS